MTLDKSLNLLESLFSHLEMEMIIPSVQLILDGGSKDNF